MTAGVLVLALLAPLVQPTAEKQRAVEKATADLRAALERAPRDAHAHAALAAAYAEHKFHRAAAESLERAVELAPAEAGLQYELGVAYLRSRQPDAAQASLRRAIELGEPSSEWLVTLAHALGATHTHEAEREELLRKALVITPDHEPAMRSLYHLLMNNHRWADAERMLRRVSSVAPIVAMPLLFNILLMQGRKLEAGCIWRTGRQHFLDPANEALIADWAEVLRNVSDTAPAKCIERSCIAGLSEALDRVHRGVPLSKSSGGSEHGGWAERLRTPLAAEVKLAADPASAQAEIRRIIETALPVVLRQAASEWQPNIAWTVKHLSAEREGGNDLVDVTIVPDRNEFEVREDKMIRPPHSTVRLADLVQHLHRKVELRDGLALYTRQATLWSMPRLLQDVTIPVSWMERLRIHDLNVWLGDGLFRNTLHNDPQDNFLCLIHGTKHVLLFPPHTGKWLYYNLRADWQAKYHPKRGMGRHYDTGIVSNNTGGINFAALDLGAYPDVVLALAEHTYAEIHAGDCLYLPRGHHHHVFSEADPDLGFHLGVNLWFSREATLARYDETASADALGVTFGRLANEDRQAPTLHQVRSVLDSCSADLTTQSQATHDEL